MAEHLNQPKPEICSEFQAMGKPIPAFRRQAAYEACKDMGLDSAQAMHCVNGVVEQLERDQPYEAQAAGMRFLDLTGTYRLFAVLLATPEPTPTTRTEASRHTFQHLYGRSTL